MAARSETMERVTVRVPSGVLSAVDERVDRGEYHCRSAAVRDALREEFYAEGDR